MIPLNQRSPSSQGCPVGYSQKCRPNGNAPLSSICLPSKLALPCSHERAKCIDDRDRLTPTYAQQGNASSFFLLVQHEGCEHRRNAPIGSRRATTIVVCFSFCLNFPSPCAEAVSQANPASLSPPRQKPGRKAESLLNTLGTLADGLPAVILLVSFLSLVSRSHSFLSLYCVFEESHPLKVWQKRKKVTSPHFGHNERKQRTSFSSLSLFFFSLAIFP